MPSQVTVTAKTGPASQVTANVIREVTNVNLDLNKRVVTYQVAGPNGPRTLEFDLVGVTTATITISGADYTMVLS